MYKDVRKEDCLFLNSEQQFNQFLELTDELELFTLILPFEEHALHRMQFIYDIWCLLSTSKEDRIENPENMMIYLLRRCFVKMVENYPIKRYIQKAALGNDRLAYICAIYISKAVGEYFTVKVRKDKRLASSFRLFKNYQTRSIRAIYNEQYQTSGKYPKELALVQRNAAMLIDGVFEDNKIHIHWYLTETINEAERVYESVFGLINDWGGRVP